MDIKFGFTSASKNVGNKDENGKRVQSKIKSITKIEILIFLCITSPPFSFKLILLYAKFESYIIMNILKL